MVPEELHNIGQAARLNGFERVRPRVVSVQIARCAAVHQQGFLCHGQLGRDRLRSRKTFLKFSHRRMQASDLSENGRGLAHERIVNHFVHEKARNSLGSLRNIVQQVLRAPHKRMSLPRGVEELLSKTKLHDTSDQRSRSRSPTNFPPKMRKEDLTGKHNLVDQNLLRASKAISLGGG